MTQNVYSVVLMAVVGLLMAGCASEVQTAGSEQKESYIVVFDEGHMQGLRVSASARLSPEEVVHSMAASLEQEYQIQAQRVFSATIPAGVYELSRAEVEEMQSDPRVAFLEKDRVITLNSVQSNAPWGLDRLDQESRSLDGLYNHKESSGSGVHAYVIDTGVLTTHQDFQGRAFHGFDAVDNDSDATDCNGHGTHVAGTIGGSTYGVAKDVQIYGIRVLDCRGSGSYSGVIAGVEWVTRHHKKPAVANMSLGGPVSAALDQAIRASVKAGVTYVVAAGNSSKDACQASPARTPEAITVGSSTKQDRRSYFSNHGNCVDVFAPGSDITSTWHTSSRAVNTISGTSMASPHVAGVAALFLAKRPEATPAEVGEAVTGGALSGKLSDVRSGSPNLLLNTKFLAGVGEEPPKEGGLSIGDQIRGLKAFRGEELFYEVEIPRGYHRVRVDISGGRGDADLYVRMGAKPTSKRYNCRPYLYGNRESCQLQVAGPATIHVRIHGYYSFSGVNLKVSER